MKALSFACLFIGLAISPSAASSLAAQGAVFQTSVTPQPDEDLVSDCRYEITLTDRERTIRGVWVIFDRGRDILRIYADPDVRAFAQRHDLALLFPFHCRAKSGTDGDLNMDPAKGIGRALFAALGQFAELSGHRELASAKLILLGFSGTGSVVILAGSTDRITGTERPYAYFRKYFERGAPWTFVVQNKTPHCCVINAKALVLMWLDAVVVQRMRRGSDAERYGFIRTAPETVQGCPNLFPPAVPIWCHGTKDAWGGENWSVSAAAIEPRPSPPREMMPAGWLPTPSFAKQWLSFVTQPDHPVMSLP